jgi:hypothetical protein
MQSILLRQQSKIESRVATKRCQFITCRPDSFLDEKDLFFGDILRHMMKMLS